MTNILDEIRAKHRRIWWTFVLRGVLGVTVGVLILLLPLESLAALALVVAIWALLSGVAEMIHAVHIRSVFKSWWTLLLGGLVSIAFGAAALYYYPVLSLVFITVWVGLWLATSGVLGIYSSVKMKRAGLAWGWPLTWGVLSVLASIVAFLEPPATLAAILLLLAVYALVSGVALLVAAWRIRSLATRTEALIAPRPAS